MKNAGENKSIDVILKELQIMENVSALTDASLLYLYGIILVRKEQRDLALKYLIQSVNAFPYNWSAWLELSKCIPSLESVRF